MKEIQNSVPGDNMVLDGGLAYLVKSIHSKALNFLEITSYLYIKSPSIIKSGGWNLAYKNCCFLTCPLRMLLGIILPLHTWLVEPIGLHMLRPTTTYSFLALCAILSKKSTVGGSP